MAALSLPFVSATAAPAPYPSDDPRSVDEVEVDGQRVRLPAPVSRVLHRTPGGDVVQVVVCTPTRVVVRTGPADTRTVMRVDWSAATAGWVRYDGVLPWPSLRPTDG